MKIEVREQTQFEGWQPWTPYGTWEEMPFFCEAIKYMRAFKIERLRVISPSSGTEYAIEIKY